MVRWEPIGGPPCFSALDFAFSENRPGVVYSYIGSSSYTGSGWPWSVILRSLDGGRTWDKWGAPVPHRPEDRAVLESNVTSIAPDPFDSNRVYVTRFEEVMQEGKRSVYTFRLFATDDDGRTWRHVKEWTSKDLHWSIHPASPLRIELDPHRPGVIYAGTNNEDIFRSRDGGRTWDSSDRLDPGLGMRDIAFHPRDPGLIHLGATFGFLRSTDGGETWSVRYRGLFFCGLVEMVLDPEDPDVVCGIHPFGRAWQWDAAVLRSTDGGATFAPFLTPPFEEEDWAVVSLASDPRDGRTVYAGVDSMEDGGLIVTHDSGEAWERVTIPWERVGIPSWMEQGSLTRVRIAPWEPYTIFVTDEVGYCYVLPQMSFDGGRTWSGPERCANVSSVRYQVWPRDERVMVASEEYRGILWVTGDGGVNWEALMLDGELSWCDGFLLHPEEPDKILVLRYQGASGGNQRRREFLVTEDRGLTWRTSSDGIPATYTIDWGPVAHPRLDYVIYCAVYPNVPGSAPPALFVSRDWGKNWEEFSTEDDWLADPGHDSFVTCITLNPEDPEAVYLRLHQSNDSETRAECTPDYIAFTLDGGRTWHRPALCGVRSIAVNPTRHEQLCALTFNDAMSPQEQKIVLWRSGDRGMSWQSVYTFSRQEDFWWRYPDDTFTIEFDPKDPDTIYMGMPWGKTRDGAFFELGALLRSQDGGASWEDISANLDVPLVEEIISTPSGEILVSTNGFGGLWRLTYRDHVPFVRGDMNQDGRVNIGDAAAILQSLFADGPVPPCREAGNANGDELYNIADAVYLLSHIFHKGTAPPPPYPACGMLAGETPFGCEEHVPCEE